MSLSVAPGQWSARLAGRKARVDRRPALAAAVASFLALELQGWKGRRGTAMASRPYAAAFLRQLFDGQRGPVSVRADWLALDSKPLAVSLSLEGFELLYQSGRWRLRRSITGPGSRAKNRLIARAAAEIARQGFSDIVMIGFDNAIFRRRASPAGDKHE